MKNKLKLCIIFTILVGWLNAQETTKIPLPTNLEEGYPRLYITENGKKKLEKTIQLIFPGFILSCDNSQYIFLPLLLYRSAHKYKPKY